MQQPESKPKPKIDPEKYFNDMNSFDIWQSFVSSFFSSPLKDLDLILVSHSAHYLCECSGNFTHCPIYPSFPDHLSHLILKNHPSQYLVSGKYCNFPVSY